MAQDVESLYAGVKALVCVVKSDRVAQSEMDRRRAYQTLAMLLRRKRHILNSHILHLIFSLVGTVDSGSQSSTIPNVMAFQDLLCDIEVKCLCLAHVIFCFIYAFCLFSMYSFFFRFGMKHLVTYREVFLNICTNW